MDIKKMLAKNYVNFRGWSSKRKLIIIESDDWGAVRMPSKEVYDTFLKEGVRVDKNYFTKYDRLESKEDLEMLFNLLSSYKDINGRHAVITANAMVANPDFDKIKESGKKEYHFELITDTYKRYPGSEDVFDFWKKEGMGNRLLWPQYHGREHINVDKWMKAVNSDIKQELIAFDNKVLLGIGTDDSRSKEYQYMAACEFSSEKHKQEIEAITSDGLAMFNTMFGFESKSFVAPCSVRGDHLDPVLKNGGVLFHQCGQQYVPAADGSRKIINKYFGQTNPEGQLYWRRNVSFEPSKGGHNTIVDTCMKDIDVAFRWGKPAVINSHRVNYSGGIDKANRENSLKLLKELLDKIVKKWPETEFLTSDELGVYMSQSINKK